MCSHYPTPRETETKEAETGADKLAENPIVLVSVSLLQCSMNTYTQLYKPIYIGVYRFRCWAVWTHHFSYPLQNVNVEGTVH